MALSKHHLEAVRKRREKQAHQAQKMEAVSRLARRVFKDFQDMHTGVLCCTQDLLRKFDPSEPLHKQIEQLQKSVERTAQMTRQLTIFPNTRRIKPKPST